MPGFPLSSQACRPCHWPGDPPNVIERFTTDPDDDLLLLPVTLGGQTYRFALDTGASAHIFDTELRPQLGPEQYRTRHVTTPSGDASSDVFRAPHACLGSLSLFTPSNVFCADLAPFRELSWTEIRGLIGMSFLQNQVVTIDPDRQTVEFLCAADPPTVGTPVTLFRNKQGIPWVVVELPGLGPRPFHLDTGNLGTGLIGHEDFETLVKHGAIADVTSSLSRDLSGVVKKREGRINGLVIGRDRHDGLIFCETPGFDSWLGLGFLSRYVVTFDFPRRVMYLKKGQSFGIPDQAALTDLALIRRGGRVLVAELDDDGPAARAGIRPFDLVVKVDDLEASKASKRDIRRHLETPGKTVRLTLRRGDREFVVALELKDPTIATKPAGLKP